MNCVICFDTFNKSTRKSISCNYCNTLICRECMGTYIDSGDTSETFCVNPECKEVWADDFIKDNMTKKFYDSTYRKKKADVLFDIERSLIPDTQRRIEAETQVAKIKKLITERKETIANLNAEIIELNRTIEDILNGKTEKTLKTVYVCKCPSNECKGFVAENGTCGLCETKTCVKCREIITCQQHECDENILKNIEEMKANTKPCPKCSALIYKIDGCDQMFCTVCHIAFSWRTLKVETSRIHNPHYYQWIREKGGEVPREQGDIPPGLQVCNDIISAKKLVDKVCTDYVDCVYVDIICDVYRLKEHYNYEIRTYDRNHVENIFEKNLENRKKYIRNEITEEEFKNEIYKKKKAENKKKEIMQILRVFTQVSGDSINLLGNTKKIGIQDLKTFWHNIHEIVNFSNDALNTIQKRYGGKCPMIIIKLNY